jgi:hypothetical protein
MPKPNKKLELLDIDPLELARQLTIMESRLYQKIRPLECLQRTRERRTDHNDNIARVIQTSNRVWSAPFNSHYIFIKYKIAHWVTDSVLSHEDSKKRAAILKHFISIADVCSSLRNPFPRCLLPLAVSFDAQLLEHGCYSIRTELAPYTAPQALMGACECATHGSTYHLRDNH